MSQLGPLCLVISVDDVNSDVIIQGTHFRKFLNNISYWIEFLPFTGVIEDLPQVETSPDINVDLYKWKIKNKYYEATIHFCKIAEKKVLMQELRTAKIEAVIIYFDCQKVAMSFYLHFKLYFSIQ